MVPFNDPCQHNFRLFAYFSTAIISVMTILFFFFVLQHVNLQTDQERTIANQESVLENQQLLLNNQEIQIKTQVLLKQLINESRAHEDREEFMLGNNTRTNIDISSSNSEKLEKIMTALNIPQLD